MEGPERMGAGPESTGIENEQLDLFVPQQHETCRINDLDISDAAPNSSEEVGPRRSHALDRRPDRLHTSGHFGVRGDRLEAVCPRRTDRSN